MSQLKNKATVMIKYQYQHISNNSLYIDEIIYQYNSYQQICNAKLSYQHPFEYITINYLSTPIKVYKIFLDLYYNDFETYRNIYHSLEGIYLQFENMLAHQRKLLKNYFILRFIPFGGNFNEFLKPFISEMKKFE